MKKGKLTDVEKACIGGMVTENISIESMCTQLDRSETLIIKETERIKSNSIRDQLYINKTASGSKGVAIMTEAASVRSDDSKSRTSPQTVRAPCIHKIRSDD